MTEQGAQKAVLGSFAVIAGVLIYQDIRQTGHARPPFRQIVALTVGAAALAALASVAPDIAGPFAILIGVAYLIAHVGTGASK